MLPNMALHRTSTVRPLKMRSLEKTLALWEAGLLSSDQVIDWAERQIAELHEPPHELIELVSYGPDRCLKRPVADFSPRPIRMKYEHGFALRAVAVNVQDKLAILAFADWAAKHCLGEDIDHPYVAIGYRLDHLLDDCQDREGAVALVLSELPNVLPGCRQVAERYAETEA